MSEGKADDISTPQGTPPKRYPLVATNRDSGPIERGERGVDIIDDCGGMIYVADEDIAHTIALLARHLSGETVTFLEQEDVNDSWDSYELDEALAAVEQHLSRLLLRRGAIEARIQAIESDESTVLTVETFTFAQLMEQLRQSHRQTPS